MKSGRSSAHQFAHAFAIADVQFDVAIPAQLARQRLHHRPRRAAGAEEPGAQIVVDTDDVPASGGERARALRADQTTRSRNECFHAPGVPCVARAVRVRRCRLPVRAVFFDAPLAIRQATFAAV